MDEGTHAAGVPTVLVVDDDPSVRSLVAAALTRAGFDVVTAEDAASARAAAAATPQTALFVLDVNVPGGGGRKLGAMLGQLCPRARVLYTSGFPSDLVEDEGILTSSSSFLPKPFSIAQLVAAVSGAVGTTPAPTTA